METVKERFSVVLIEDSATIRSTIRGCVSDAVDELSTRNDVLLNFHEFDGFAAGTDVRCEDALLADRLLVICDHDMPGSISGEAILAIIAEINPEAVLYMLTASETAGSWLDNVRVLRKPVDYDVVIKSVKDAATRVLVA